MVLFKIADGQKLERHMYTKLSSLFSASRIARPSPTSRTPKSMRSCFEPSSEQRKARVPWGVHGSKLPGRGRCCETTVGRFSRALSHRPRSTWGGLERIFLHGCSCAGGISAWVVSAPWNAFVAEDATDLLQREKKRREGRRGA